MKLKQRRAFDKMLSQAMPAVLAYMVQVGADEPEEATQNVMLKMCVEASSNPEFCEPWFFWTQLNAYRDLAACGSFCNECRSPASVDLWHARNVVEPHTPYNVVIAAEMADKADTWGILPVVMGDTLSEEAEYFNMSRQRIHQMVNQARDAMSDYLISE